MKNKVLNFLVADYCIFTHQNGNLYAGESKEIGAELQMFYSKYESLNNVPASKTFPLYKLNYNDKTGCWDISLSGKEEIRVNELYEEATSSSSSFEDIINSLKK